MKLKIKANSNTELQKRLEELGWEVESSKEDLVGTLRIYAKGQRPNSLSGIGKWNYSCYMYSFKYSGEHTTFKPPYYDLSIAWSISSGRAITQAEADVVKVLADRVRKILKSHSSMEKFLEKSPEILPLVKKLNDYILSIL